MSERDRGNNVITWSIVLIIFGISCFFIAPNTGAPESWFQVGPIAIIAGVLFIIWGAVLRGPTRRPDNTQAKRSETDLTKLVHPNLANQLSMADNRELDKTKDRNDKSLRLSRFIYRLLFAIVTSFIGGYLLHAVLTR